MNPWSELPDYWTIRAVCRPGFVAALVLSAIGAFSEPAMGNDYRSALVRATEARDRAIETGSVEDWSKALQAFEGAGAIERSKEVLFEIANAASHLGLDDEAYAAYAESLMLGLTGEAAGVASAFIRDNEAHMAKLVIEGPPGATVGIDERRRATLPLAGPLPVLPGSHELEVRGEGREVWQRRIALAPGQSQVIRVELLPIPEAEPFPSALAEPEPEKDRGPSPPASEARPPSVGWGLPTLVAGGALATTGLLTIALSSVALDDERQTLAENCVTLEGDECKNTTRDQHDAAQEAADRIGTLKSVRWVGVAGVAVGAAGAVAGLIQILTTDRRDAAAPRVDARIGPRELGATLVVGF